MQGLLRGTCLCLTLALGDPPGAQPLHAPPPDSALPDTAGLRQGLAAALGRDFEIVRTELHAGLQERAGIFWLAHLRPLRSGDYHLRYVYEYRDRVRPDDPLYTHVEHTSAMAVGEAGCLRRAERRTACLGDVIVLPVVAGDAKGPFGGHVFEVSRRGDAGEARPFAQPAPEGGDAPAVPNPAAPHLRYLGVDMDEMPHRSLGATVELRAVFEAGAPGALELAAGSAVAPVVVVERGTPVTVLLEHERIRAYNQQTGFGSHSGNQYSTDVLILQPGDRMTLQFFTRSVRGRDFTPEEKEAFRRTSPTIAVRPFRLERQRRFNAWLADHLPAGR